MVGENKENFRIRVSRHVDGDILNQDVPCIGDLYSLHLAGGSEEPGGLQLSSAEGVMQDASFSIFSGLSPVNQPGSHVLQGLGESVGDQDFAQIVVDQPVKSEVDECDPGVGRFGSERVDVNIATLLCYDSETGFAEGLVDSVGCSLDSVTFGVTSGDVNIQHGGHNSSCTDLDLVKGNISYFFEEGPVFCYSSPRLDCSDIPPSPTWASVVKLYDVKDAREVCRPCGSVCKGVHWLSGFKLQLNPCAFFDASFDSRAVDSNLSYILEGVTNGFRIVDSSFRGSYVSPNYDSILRGSPRLEMDRTIRSELNHGKVARVDTIPTCVHSLGAIKKSDGSLRPITDCKRPLGSSINNFMNEVCTDFSYISIDDVSDSIFPGCYFLVLDIKLAYRSVNVRPDNRTYQGFSWTLDGKSSWYEDHC